LRALLLISLLFLSCGKEACAEEKKEQRRSGYEYMSRETRAMQDDDFSNPGMLWVLDGESLWRQRVGATNKACADCHAGDSMRGVAPRYPAYDKRTKRPINLEQRVNSCRTTQQKAEPLKYESKELLALTAYIGYQSRGMPIAVAVSKAISSHLEAGRKTFFRKQGQISLACVQCHDDNSGKRLAGSVIPQAHPTGYPIYRLEWQGAGSLHRRLRNCLIGMRAEPYEFGAPELVDLELYLMWRAKGMKLETPAVRP
jgi:L-cysteine S-thiosulfotransferase